jgi:hypothetical protein
MKPTDGFETGHAIVCVNRVELIAPTLWPQTVLLPQNLGGVNCILAWQIALVHFLLSVIGKLMTRCKRFLIKAGVHVVGENAA